jgi:hypothetical protein
MPSSSRADGRSRRISAANSTRNAIPLAMIGWTTVTGASVSAKPWNTSPTTWIATPSSQSGRAISGPRIATPVSATISACDFWTTTARL